MHTDIQNKAGSSKQSPEGQLARAKALERGRDWSGAIDAYLGITTQDTTDLDFLEGVSSAFHNNLNGYFCTLTAFYNGQKLSLFGLLPICMQSKTSSVLQHHASTLAV